MSVRTAPGAIFVGVTKGSFRKTLGHVIQHVRQKYPIFVDPCAGGFEVAVLARAAGYPAESIITSDIGPVSYGIASYVNDRPCSPYTLQVDHDYWATFLQAGLRPSWPLFLILLKCFQINEWVFHQETMLRDILKRPAVYVEQLTKQLDRIKGRLEGFTFEPADMRRVISKYAKDGEAFIYVNPPAFKGGYEKLYDDRGGSFSLPEIKPVPMFDWTKEFGRLKKQLFNAKALTVLYKVEGLEEDERSHCFYLKELKIGEQVDALLINRPADLPLKYRKLDLKRTPHLQPLKLKVFDGEIRPDSKIDMFFTKREHALYYRALWAHRLGQTDAESFCLWTIDGALFATCGLHTEKLFRMVEEHVFEAFGFATPHAYYPNLVRLLMMCLTSEEFKRRCFAAPKFRKMAFISFKGIKTTCLSRYRKVKLNNGILEIIHREKTEETGMYRIIYRADFRRDAWADCVNWYLADVARYKAEPAAEEVASAPPE